MGRTVESKSALTFTHNGFLWCSIYQTRTWSLHRTNVPTGMRVHSRLGTTQSHHGLQSQEVYDLRRNQPGPANTRAPQCEASGAPPHVWPSPGARAKRGHKTRGGMRADSSHWSHTVQPATRLGCTVQPAAPEQPA